MDPWLVASLTILGVLSLSLFAPVVAYALGNSGHWELALKALALPLSSGGDITRLLMLGYAGRVAESLELGDRLERGGLNDYAQIIWVNTLITAGRYKKAIEIGDQDTNPEPEKQRLWPLRQINLAEAEYNLGNWERALERLDHLRRLWPKLSAIEDAGERMQRAWILAHLGQGDEARQSFAAGSEIDLPPIFRAEYHYTHAAVALAQGMNDEALAAVEKGISLAVRVPSRRNGLFLCARVRVARAEYTAALKDFETAATADYRAQGGDGLLGWGDLLKQLGRDEEARDVWKMVVERDPESESARLAAQREPGSQRHALAHNQG